MPPQINSAAVVSTRTSVAQNFLPTNRHVRMGIIIFLLYVYQGKSIETCLEDYFDVIRIELRRRKQLWQCDRTVHSIDSIRFLRLRSISDE